MLTFHLSLVLLILTLLAVLIRQWLLSIITGAFCLATITPTLFTFLPHEPPKVVGPTLHIMAMNLKYTHENGSLITDQMARFNPDLVVIEDYTPYAKEMIDTQFEHSFPIPRFSI